MDLGELALYDPFESFDYSNRTAAFWMMHRIRCLAKVSHKFGKL